MVYSCLTKDILMHAKLRISIFFLKCEHSKQLHSFIVAKHILDRKSMNKLHSIMVFILFGAISTRQIGLIANHIFTYEFPKNDPWIRTITFGNRSSCYACLCPAFMSTINYVAINCYKDNNTCSLLTSLINITGIIPFENSSLYILSDIPI